MGWVSRIKPSEALPMFSRKASIDAARGGVYGWVRISIDRAY